MCKMCVGVVKRSAGAESISSSAAIPIKTPEIIKERKGNANAQDPVLSSNFLLQSALTIFVSIVYLNSVTNGKNNEARFLYNLQTFAFFCHIR